MSKQRSKEGARLKLIAEKKQVVAKESLARGDHIGFAIGMGEAESFSRRSKEHLEVSGPLELGPGGEAIPPAIGDELYGIRATLKQGASNINLDASCTRLELLGDGDAVALGVDAAQSISADNPVEQMLIHQMSLCHKMSMKFLSQSEKYAMHPNHPSHVEQSVKLVNASARLMDTYQRGLQTLIKLRSGGKQQVTVTHIHQQVQVADGGQALVTGGGIEGGKSGK